MFSNQNWAFRNTPHCNVSINISANRGGERKHRGPPGQIAAIRLQPGMSRNARTIAPASWPRFAPRGTCKSTSGQEGTLASSGTRTLMTTPQSSPAPSIRIQGCAFSISDAVASYQQVRSASQIAICAHCAHFHPAHRPDWNSARQIGRTILCIGHR